MRELLHQLITTFLPQVNTEEAHGRIPMAGTKFTIVGVGRSHYFEALLQM